MLIEFEFNIVIYIFLHRLIELISDNPELFELQVTTEVNMRRALRRAIVYQSLFHQDTTR